MSAHLVLYRRPAQTRIKLVGGLTGIALIPALMAFGLLEHADDVTSTRARSGHCGGASLSMPPEEVVQTQVGVLRINEELGKDRGIRVAWRLASPANRAYTGPFWRFAEMVRSPTYAPLLDNEGARFGPVDVRGGIASQRVVVMRDGVWLAYRFMLSRDASGSWRTDSVLPEPLE